MKTTTKNPSDSPLATAGALAVIFAATLLIGVVFAISGCRSHAKAASTVTATSGMSATSADTLRTQSLKQERGSETSRSSGREQTHIRIARDSAGRPTDIFVDKASAGESRKESAAAGTTATVAEGSGTASACAESKEDTIGTLPAEKEDWGVESKSVVWLLCCIILFITGILRIINRK